MNAKERRSPRLGWPLDHIPAGERWWRLFVEVATDEQIDQTLAALRDMDVDSPWEPAVAGRRH